MRKSVVVNLLDWFLISTFLLGLVTVIIAYVSQNRAQQDVRSLVEQARVAWVARDANALTQLFASDGELIVPGQRWQGQAKIQQEVSKFAEQYTDVSITIRQIVIDGNRAVVEWHYEDTEKKTGKRNKADDAIVLEVKNGRIIYWREYFDTITPEKESK